MKTYWFCVKAKKMLSENWIRKNDSNHQSGVTKVMKQVNYNVKQCLST